MKRDPDVARSILSWIEDGQQFDGWSKRLYERPSDNSSPINDVDWSTFYYNLLQCELSRLIISNASSHPYKVTISGLTPDGHEFLEAYRKPDVWNRVKSEANKAGGFSLGFFTAIAKGIVKKRVEELIEKHVFADESDVNMPKN